MALIGNEASFYHLPKRCVIILQVYRRDLGKFQIALSLALFFHNYNQN